MLTHPRRVVLLSLYVSVFALSLAAAQDQPAAGGPLAAIQAKTSFSDEERGTVRTWLTERTQAIIAGTADAASIRAEYKGSNQFKDMVASTLAEVIAPTLKAAEANRAASLVALLAGMAEPSTAKTLLDALGDNRAPVRAAAIAGLRAVRAKAGAGGNPAEITDALREAGKKETSGGALRLIYGAFNPADAAGLDAKPLLAALLDVLDARSAVYTAAKSPSDVPAEAVDAAGIAIGAANAKNLSEGEAARLATATAKLLKHAMTRYVGGVSKVNDRSSSAMIELRNQTEMLIEEAEKVLVETLKPQPAPAMSAPLRSGDKLADLKTEYGKWAKLVQEKLSLDISLPAE